WKYSISLPTPVTQMAPEKIQYASIKCYPSPADKKLSIDLALNKSTHARILLLDENGRRIKVIDNADKSMGDYQYKINTEDLRSGVYHVVLKTHEDDQSIQVIVTH